VHHREGETRGCYHGPIDTTPAHEKPGVNELFADANRLLTKYHQKLHRPISKRSELKRRHSQMSSGATQQITTLW
jgi:hypothetical protein